MSLLTSDLLWCLWGDDPDAGYARGVGGGEGGLGREADGVAAGPHGDGRAAARQLQLLYGALHRARAH